MIEACIESILDSCRQAELREYRIAVVADCCTDLTTRRARRALGDAGELLVCEARSAGAARRAGVEAILQFFSKRAPSQIWLANTDADTTVPPDWLALQLKLADAGAAGIAGRCLIASVVPPVRSCSRTMSRWRDNSARWRSTSDNVTRNEI